MNQDDIFITKEKKAELEKELVYISGEGRTEIATRLEEAKELGDLKENAEYHQAREDQAFLEDRIRVITETLKNGKIIKGGHKTEVTIGAIVTISKKGSSAKSKYQIVGPQEADPAEGKLSFDSPLVTAMLGKTEGEFFSFETPSGDVVEYKVASIK